MSVQILSRVWNHSQARQGDLLVLLAIAGACYAYWFSHRPLTYKPGVLIGADPTQVNLPRDEPAFDFGDFHLKPLARFTLDARLLHSRVYRFDRERAWYRSISQ